MEDFLEIHTLPTEKPLKHAWLEYTSAAPDVARVLMGMMFAKASVKFDFSYKVTKKLRRHRKIDGTHSKSGHTDAQRGLALALNEIGGWMYVG